MNKYAVKLNGKIITQPNSSKSVAEQYIQSLPQEQRILAEIIQVNDNGKELLFG